MIINASFVMIIKDHSFISFAYFALITICGDELVIFPGIVVLL